MIVGSIPTYAIQWTEVDLEQVFYTILKRCCRLDHILDKYLKRLNITYSIKSYMQFLSPYFGKIVILILPFLIA